MTARAPSKRMRARPAAAGKRRAPRPRPVIAPSPASPFEEFVLGLLDARGATWSPAGHRSYEARLDPELARHVGRETALLVFDSDRPTLPESAVFVAPGSRFGLQLLAAARGHGYASRVHLQRDPGADARAIARRGFVLHGVEASAPRLDPPRWIVQVVYHFTITLRGGAPEQDPRMVIAEPRGPVFEFLEPEERKRWQREPGFPDEPVWWGDVDVRAGTPEEEAAALWPSLVEWLRQAQAMRLERWRRRCEEGREKDLRRINAYYKTRLSEEEERRRRRRDDADFDEETSEEKLKLEWSRRVRSIRARWQPGATLDLWGIEEIARPRVSVAWRLDTPDGISRLGGEIDLAEGALVRRPCRSCGRLAGEFWWEDGLVCRRCRSRRSGQRSERAVPSGRSRAGRHR